MEDSRFCIRRSTGPARMLASLTIAQMEFTETHRCVGVQQASSGIGQTGVCCGVCQ